MYVYYDDQLPPPRQHPWTIVETQPEARYWDLKAHPELIPRVLEDFKPWAHYEAIQKFYHLLASLNGPDSLFETNDCAFGVPHVDAHTPEMIRHVFEADPIGVHGRLALIFRDLRCNTSRPHMDWLKRNVHDTLRDQVRNYPSVIAIGEWPHLFTAIDKEGHALTLQFWAWGDDEKEAMAFLSETFENLAELFRGMSASAKQQMEAEGKDQTPA